MSQTRRLAAIFAADVAGYSRLMGDDEEGTHERLRAHLREVVDPKIREHRGRIVKNTGDGLLAEFASVVDAVRCAVEVQAGMADRNAAIPANTRIDFRVGVHQGDVVIEDNDIFGDAVNVAARLEGLAEPGGICVSARVRGDAAGKLDLAFEDMGQQELKNIARPVRVYAWCPEGVAGPPTTSVPIAVPTRHRRSILAPIGAALAAVLVIGVVTWWLWPMRSSPTATPAVAATTATGQPFVAPRLSIVVLPFANLSNDPEQEYFADAITEDLTTDLSRIADSFVIARSTAFTYKGKSVDVRQVARELGVRYVLEGSVRRTGDQVRVNVQLIDAGTGSHMWADRFQTDRANLAEAQDEITSRLARTLNLELAEAVGRRVEQEQATNPDAQDYVMRGWAWWFRRMSPANRQEAQQAFARALEIDPRSVDARIGLATILVSNIADGWSARPEEDLSQSEKLLLEAVERNPNHSMAHYAMAMVHRSQGRLIESKIEFETAITLDRNNARAYFNLGQTLIFLGQPQAAIPHIEKAIRLNPYDPNVASFYWCLGMCHLLLGDADQAIELLLKARTSNPSLFYVYLWLAGAFGFKGDVREAKNALAQALTLKPEINSFARLREYEPWITNPPFWALREKSVNIGLRRAGFPEQ